MAESITVEVCYALPERVSVAEVRLPAGSTVAHAIERSGLLARFPALTHEPLDIGIFSIKVTAQTVLNDFDRVELYRPLRIDPKQARRLRAETSAKRRRS